MKNVKIIAAVISVAAVITGAAFSGCSDSGGKTTCAHNYVLSSSVAPTCAEAGENVYTCTKCGAGYSVDVPATGEHTYAVQNTEATCSAPGLAEKKCTVCGEAAYSYTIYKDHNYVDGVCTVCGDVQEGTTGLKYSFTDDVATVIGYVGTDENVVIPSSIDGHTVLMILDAAFASNEVITSVQIPSTVTYIGLKAFMSCPNLTKVTGGEGVKEIGDYAFLNCKSLAEFSFSSALSLIETSAFENTGLKSVTFTSGYVLIHPSAFKNSKSLTSFNAASTTVYVCDYAFMGCSSLEYAAVADKTDAIGISAFSGCKSLKQFDGLNYVAYIGNYAFSGCASLTGISLGARLNFIGTGAFYGCTSLVSVSMLTYDSSLGYNFEDGAYTTSLIYLKQDIMENWIYRAPDGTLVYISDISDPAVNASRLTDEYNEGVWIVPMPYALR